MKENSIEEVIERLEKGINDIWFSTIYYSQEQEEKDLKILLSDYKRVLKENEEWDRKFCNLQNLYFKLQDESESKQKEYQETYKDVREELKELRKENEELKADNYELNNRITDLLENIPVQKIKDKIEEIDKIYNDIPEDEGNFTKAILIKEKQTLQELLDNRK